MVMRAKDKMVRVEEDYFFPGFENTPAVTIKAESREEAEKKYEEWKSGFAKKAEASDNKEEE